MSQPNMVSFSTARQATVDVFYSSATGITEETVASYTFAVLANDARHNSPILWCLDDGNTAKNLLMQDTGRNFG